ncbi:MULTISPECIES: hypothetical protein [unclassified Flavobacterium]|uniref:hypothetical protein n=1 Tax=unclassified Flavobacterium TaxID=196869 RepID=UPI001F14360E|nr:MULTISPECIES: hypothetical protein [unclassified Flavobacterium]UMY66508.1 hypothetical protein MKO97_03755 [Flavobacterium sp. HJ-32-4]
MHFALNQKQVHFDHYKSGNRDLIYIDAIHIGRPEFYADIKFTIDSLKREGYTIVYEENRAVMSSLADTVLVDRYKRKLRRITGIYYGDYSDAKDNKSLRIPKIKGLVAQTVENTGIDRAKDVWGDYTLYENIDRYEAERGEIALTECDWTTGKNEKYKCASINKSAADYLLITLRNKRLLHVVDSIQRDKVAILYGAAHKQGFLYLLHKKDSSWVHQPRKNYY